jgi:hypothetical protein
LSPEEHGRGRGGPAVSVGSLRRRTQVRAVPVEHRLYERPALRHAWDFFDAPLVYQAFLGSQFRTTACR